VDELMNMSDDDDYNGKQLRDVWNDLAYCRMN
jgi:hypothetical protein